ncbi:MATE family efflux transporter [Fuchsiella alkaliacetigena]|uniref:MATE family efflux transporter n=1 Tax=Fuchsiella alkaliacetigena TaxID=957042 RepID=UPI00200A5CC6|nr:MATE family efflux transporter [Fuchsiella alkaliacetigena]MCK8823836.1 MATE family efflux transporter [Fuchsiella alkaliacetigena]
MKSKKAVLTEGKIRITLIKLALPMLAGILGIVLLNLIDTFFIGQLGTTQLAAISYTFPVILFISSISHGIGAGTSAIVSRAIGKKNHQQARRLTTDSLLLALVLVIIFVVIGILTIEPVFKLLGAETEVMPYIKSYMEIWYLGMFFVIFPIIGNNAIRALGDTKTPGLIMIIAALINLALDPLLIFGIGFFPELGIAGAAIATVIAKMAVFVIAIYVLGIREKLIVLHKVPLRKVLISWKSILYIGVPTAVTRMVIPAATGVTTALLSGYGTAAVAGYGVATRIEFFALVFVNALGSVIGPFVGQNLGAKKISRIKEGLSFSEKLSLFIGALSFLLLAVLARPIGRLFNDDPAVISNITLYLRIVPLAYGFKGILLITTTILNVLNKPLVASGLNVLQMFVIYLPLAFLGSFLLGIPGIFAGLTVSYFISGIVSHVVLKSSLNEKAIITESILEH